MDFKDLLTILLGLVGALAGWTLRQVLSLKGRVAKVQAQLDVFEARHKMILEGADGQDGVFNQIRYIRSRASWVASAIHRVRDRLYHHERELKMDGMPPLDLPPE